MAELPCNGDGVCMRCSNKPSDEELLTCRTCITPWHVVCLASPPPTLASTIDWMCPDCSPTSDVTAMVGSAKPLIAGNGGAGKSGELVAAIRAIEADPSLSEREKAKRRQKLVSGRAGSEEDQGVDPEETKKGDSRNDVMDLIDERFNCTFCLQLLERPVTTPCGHNFCLKCFNKWVGQGKNTCAKCRNTIPYKMMSQPRINSTLVVAIRMARMKKTVVNGGDTKTYHVVHNQNRPDSAFTTERAKKTGKANAASGKIFVTIPRDHFGPITADYDPKRNQGLNVGDSWADRLECRQWGAHFPHVSGICGQSKHGAQSVALSGGYEDDEDHGEWFLYTGSGGRDLSGNKRTNKDQSFDQKFEKSNEALRVSCLKGYPVRVVRSHKEKRSAYAPTEGVRYDGIYRIEKCWRKVGKQGFKVCRYLFVRCDNDPAPWTSDVHGDRPKPFPSVPELKHGTDITERKVDPSWDFDKEEGWKWKKPPPQSVHRVGTQDPILDQDEKIIVKAIIKKNQNTSVTKMLLKEFSCSLCHKVLTLPLTTPCAHNFCKPCLEATFAGQAFIQERGTRGGRSLRAKKTIMKCPSCPLDISDFLQNPQVNRELMEVIGTLELRASEENESQKESSNDGSGSSVQGAGVGEEDGKNGVGSEIEMTGDLEEGEEEMVGEEDGELKVEEKNEKQGRKRKDEARENDRGKRSKKSAVVDV